MWIRVDDSLLDDLRVFKLAEITARPVMQIPTMLLGLWCWAVNNRLEGTLSELDWRAVEHASRWDGDPKSFFNALISVGYVIASDGGFALYDWQQISGNLYEKRGKDRARKSVRKTSETARNFRDFPSEFLRKSDGNPADVQLSSSGIPYATIPNRTKPIDDDENRAPARESTDEHQNETVLRVRQHFEETFDSRVSACIEEEIGGYLGDGLEAALICEAIDQAVKHGVHNWAYASSMLGNCTDQGIKTLSEYQTSQGVRMAEKTAARARAAPTIGNRRSRDFAELEYANQRTYSKEDFAKLTASVDNL